MVALIQTPEIENTHNPIRRKGHLCLVHDSSTVNSSRSIELRVAVFSAIGLLALCALLFSLRNLQLSNQASADGIEIASVDVAVEGYFHTVQQGETMWEIAESLTEGDPRKVVFKLAQENGSERIWAGQQLFIPNNI